jgi:negative regulator of flagellin synthesis FlgM
MRVDAYNPISPLYKTNKTTRTNAAAVAGAGKDQVEISSFGRDYQVAKEAVAEASDIREDKVAEIKGKLGSNDYQVDTGEFASLLLEKYKQL